jgi:Zn-dependent M28 family amino/carboxypeptidase
MVRRSSLLVCALVGALVVTAAPAVADPNNNNSQKLRSAVSLAGVREHQAALQAIADANNGTRYAGSPGHVASAQYVYDTMQAAGYDVSFQPFSYQFNGDETPAVLNRISPSPKSFVNRVDFRSMVSSVDGDVTAPLVAVDLVVPSPGDNGNTSGCEAADFAGFPAGAIALMQRGTCTFQVKLENAAAAGAVAGVVFNEGNSDARSNLNFGNAGTPSPPIPGVTTTFATGDELRAGRLSGPTGSTVRVKVDRIVATLPTKNVIAETPGGDPDNVVVVGAHLDSVETGPGINDDGSGTAVDLEIAEQMAKVKPRNKVRFIWFSAEEAGLLGSFAYVASLSEAQKDQIAAMLDFDMLGSPNFARFVYDGDGDELGPSGPEGSSAIEAIFDHFFDAQGLFKEPVAFDGRSDYVAFTDEGIPAGGVFTGAEVHKTPAQQAIYGGTVSTGLAGQFDPCYHLACDTFANFSPIVLDQMADAAAHAVITLAQSTSVVNGERGKGNFNTARQIDDAASK